MTFLLNLKYSLRSIRKNLLYSTLSIVVIAVGMSLCIPLYSIINVFSFSKPSYIEGEELVSVSMVGANGAELEDANFDAYIFQRLVNETGSFRDIGAIQQTRMALNDGQIGESYPGAAVTPNFLQMTGVVPILGRSFLPSDYEANAAPVAIISYRIWQNYYAGDDGIVGRDSDINGIPHNIVGVMPEGFEFPFNQQIWTPLYLPANPQANNDFRLEVVATLSDPTMLNNANADVMTLMTNISDSFPSVYGGRNLEVYEFGYMPRNDVLSMMLFSVTASIVLLICINAANLLLVRNDGRTQEFAIYTALGSSELQLARKILLESLLVCVAGTMVGLVGAWLILEFLQSQLAWMTRGELPLFWDFTLSWKVVGYSLAVMVIIWISSSSSTIRRIYHRDFRSCLGSGTTSTRGKDSALALKLTIATEVIFTFLLLVISGALVFSIFQANRISLGTSENGFATAEITLPQETYPEPEDRYRFFQDYAQILSEYPGVESISATTAFPLSRGMEVPIQLADRDIRVDGVYPRMNTIWTSATYFEAMEVERVSGRFFDFADTADSMPVAIVDEVLALNLWPNQDPIGKQIQFNPGQNFNFARVVGVISPILQSQPTDETVARGSVYVPLTQNTPDRFDINVEVSGDPNDYLNLLKQAASEVDRGIALTDVVSLSELLEISRSFSVLVTEIFVSICAVALMLSTIGILGVVSRSVMSRVSEIGVRRAIGSSDYHILALLLRPGLVFLGLGIIFGGGSAFLIINLLSQVFTNILDALMPISLAVTILVSGIVLVASYIPAKKVVIMEPGEALHYE